MTKLSFEMFDFVFPSSSSGSNCWNIPNTFSSCSWIQSYSWKWQKYWKHVQNMVNSLNSAKEYQLLMMLMSCVISRVLYLGMWGLCTILSYKTKNMFKIKTPWKLYTPDILKNFFIKMCKSFQDNLPTIARFPNTAKPSAPPPQWHLSHTEY